jgi:epoxide hydrolase
MNIQPFRIEVPQLVLDDLHERLAKTRFTPGMEGADWDHRTNSSFLKQLCDYRRKDFDWRKQENYLNTFKQFRAEVDGFKSSVANPSVNEL